MASIQVFAAVLLRFPSFFTHSGIISYLIYLFIQFNLLILQLISKFGYLFWSSVSVQLTVLPITLFLGRGRGEFEKCVCARTLILHACCSLYLEHLTQWNTFRCVVSRQGKKDKSLVETQLIFSFKDSGCMFQIESIVRPLHTTDSRNDVRTFQHLVLSLCSFVGSHIFYC